MAESLGAAAPTPDGVTNLFRHERAGAVCPGLFCVQDVLAIGHCNSPFNCESSAWALTMRGSISNRSVGMANLAIRNRSSMTFATSSLDGDS